ncbi:cyd operon protein YbgE [Vibrio sp. MarTm2]|uniref:Cytochrome bd biosynthesis protein n=3 Tax=Vibrio TaxID=662 RepID=A0A0A5I1I2_PHOS4|nr:MULTISPECIES: cyd operon protein YbgE [Vibrio]KGY09604.1 cytochrome bd biosynthesis protein [Vibrio sinaloensis]KHA61883.1 cytochrome bd biosynthesis protein [Vibrio variabilis]KHD24872.1 cytochrome bd biosynthesis protein [Vibrio caribbeanicus]KHT44865.1 cytochrome bd biosynthesis protein [Vibrio sinaloensis]KIE19905.1 cytochrome bd biosynthesis protein [Vibrio sinaloensis]
MSNLAAQVAKLHAPLDKTLFRVLSLVLGFYHVAMVMWDPEAYSASIGGFNALISPLLIWAICSSMVFGLSFKPRNWYWQILFSPYFSLAILSYLTLLRVF